LIVLLVIETNRICQLIFCFYRGVSIVVLCVDGDSCGFNVFVVDVIEHHIGQEAVDERGDEAQLVEEDDELFARRVAIKVAWMRIVQSRVESVSKE